MVSPELHELEAGSLYGAAGDGLGFFDPARGGGEARNAAGSELLNEIEGQCELALNEDGGGRAGNDALEDAKADGDDLGGVGVGRDIWEGFVDDLPGERLGLGALRGGPVVRRVVGQVEEHF